MQTSNKLLNDLAQMAGGAAGVLADMKRELESGMKRQMESWLASMDLVTREEFEAVKQMAAKARTEQEALIARLDALEKAPAAPRKKAKT